MDRSIMAERLVFTKKGNTAGSFSGSLYSTNPGSGWFRPAGDGFGTVIGRSGGGIKFSGSLADGSKVTQKTSLSEQGIWPLYSSLYKGAGSLIGWLQVTNAEVASAAKSSGSNRARSQMMSRQRVSAIKSLPDMQGPRPQRVPAHPERWRCFHHRQ